MRSGGDAGIRGSVRKVGIVQHPGTLTRRNREEPCPPVRRRTKAS